MRTKKFGSRDPAIRSRPATEGSLQCVLRMPRTIPFSIACAPRSPKDFTARRVLLAASVNAQLLRGGSTVYGFCNAFPFSLKEICAFALKYSANITNSIEKQNLLAILVQIPAGAEKAKKLSPVIFKHIQKIIDILKEYFSQALKNPVTVLLGIRNKFFGAKLFRCSVTSRKSKK